MVAIIFSGIYMNSRAATNDQNDCSVVESGMQVRGLARATWEQKNTLRTLKKLGATPGIAQLLLLRYAVESRYQRCVFYSCLFYGFLI